MSSTTFLKGEKQQQEKIKHIPCEADFEEDLKETCFERMVRLHCQLIFR